MVTVVPEVKGDIRFVVTQPEELARKITRRAVNIAPMYLFKKSEGVPFLPGRRQHGNSAGAIKVISRLLRFCHNA